MYKKKLRTGDIYNVDLPKNNGYCLAGIHRCIIIRQFGSTVQVVPISSNRNNIHFGEIPIDRGKDGVIKKSKLKVGQWTTVSIDHIKEYKGKSDKETRDLIANFISQEIVGCLKTAA